MKFMDVHTHLHDGRFRTALPKIITQATDIGVQWMVTCATREDNFEETFRLSRKYSCVLPCFGIHPWFLDTLTPNWEHRLADRLESTLSAVGETGLDFMSRGSNRDLQLAVFKVHLGLAQDLKRPINIHIRKAWDALIHILKKNGPIQSGGLIHSFSGSSDLVRVLETYNLHLSFSGAVTRPNAKKVVGALNTVSLDRIVFETDSPDIYPSFKGIENLSQLLNTPANLHGIINIAAQRRNMAFEALADVGYRNALHLFAPIMQD